MKLIKRNDPTNTVLLTPENAVYRVYLRCPHCGQVDWQYSAQGIKDSHFPITRVGAVQKYECGRCRRQFHSIEFCVPENTDPLEFYEKIANLLNA